MFGQIASFVVDVVVGFFVYLLLARFLFQWLRVPFRNAVGEFLIALTNWQFVFSIHRNCLVWYCNAVPLSAVNGLKSNISRE